MNRQDLEHALAEGRTVEARHHGGGWFRPTNPQHCEYVIFWSE